MADIPVVDPKFYEPTPKQKEVLIRYGKWYDGMTRDEAGEILDTLDFVTMSAGLHKLRVLPAEMGLQKDGSEKKDKYGNKCVKITFRNERKEEISDFFHYPQSANIECPSAFKLGGLRRAMGIPPNQVMNDTMFAQRKWYVWGIVIEEHTVDSNGKPVMKNGKPMVYNKLGTRYYPIDKKPTIEGDPLDPNFNGTIGSAFINIVKDRTRGGNNYASAPDADDTDSTPGGTTYNPPPVTDEDAF